MKTTKSKKGTSTAIRIIHKCQLCGKRYKLWDNMISQAVCPYCLKIEKINGKIIIKVRGSK